MHTLGCLVALGGLLIGVASADSEIMNALSRESELSTFRELLNGANWLSFLEDEEKVTIFAPTNHAIDNLGITDFQQLANRDGKKKPYLRNFFTAVAVHPPNGPSQVPSFAKGNPMLFFTPHKEDSSRFYVNEALVIRKSRGNDKVILYLIDTVPAFAQFDNSPPNADDVIQNVERLYSLRRYSVDPKAFRNSINHLGVRELFSSGTRATFFIPIGSSHGGVYTRDVVNAHVIPGKVLFTPQFEEGRFLTSETHTEISFVNETESNNQFILLVKSTTSGLGNFNGSVVSRITVANVPVMNGVIHFIESPLGVPTRSIYDYINDKQESRNRFNMFIDIVRQLPEFGRELREGSQRKTLFVPSNQATRVLPHDVWSQYRSNRSALGELFRYHLVSSYSITEEGVRSAHGAMTVKNVAGVPLVLRHVRCTTGCPRHSLVVESGGVNASVISSDIGAINGVIHIIDRVLGAPSHSLGWKLQNEEPLTTTQIVATKGFWNKVLDDPRRKFTMFAPNNEAWRRVSQEYPTEYKRLVTLPTELHKQAGRVMDRHLAATELSIDDLFKVSEIHMVTGDNIYVKHQNNKIELAWDGQLCKIVGSTIQATNGKIHIIDCVFMRPRDLIASAAPAQLSAGVASLIAVIVAVLLLGRP